MKPENYRESARNDKSGDETRCADRSLCPGAWSAVMGGMVGRASLLCRQGRPVRSAARTCCSRILESVGEPVGHLHEQAGVDRFAQWSAMGGH